jgi:hypothetical protein
MAFKKMTKRQYPPRLWALVGFPGSGKSTLATQMRTPILVVDADHRFDEVLDLAAGDVYELSGAPSDNVNADAIARILGARMPGAAVGTIVVDSLTAIITPLIVQAMADKDQGRVKSLAAAFRTKALAMRQLQDAVTRWGCDVLWIYHVDKARDAQANEVVRASISQTELARLTRSINLQLRIVQEGERRGVRVVWARRGRSGVTLWDESGTWAGMPERIEQAVYDGLSPAEQDRLEQDPGFFPNPETAIAWGAEQGAFEALQHARNAYHKLRREKKPKDARGMTKLWKADVQRRLAAQAEMEEEPAETEELSESPAAPPETEQPAPGSEEPRFECAQCGQVITPFQANGQTYSVSALVDICNNLNPPRQPTCGPCLKKLKEWRREAAGKKAKAPEAPPAEPQTRTAQEDARVLAWLEKLEIEPDELPALIGLDDSYEGWLTVTYFDQAQRVADLVAACDAKGMAIPDWLKEEAIVRDLKLDVPEVEPEQPAGAEPPPAAGDAAPTRGDLLNALQDLLREAHDLDGRRYSNPQIRKRLLREYNAKSLTELSDEQVLQLTGTVRAEIAAMKEPATGEEPEVGEPAQAEMRL